MTAGLRVLALLVRRDGRRGLGSLLLTVAGVAVATTIGLLVVSVGPSVEDRADRTAWREPAAADAGGPAAVAVQMRCTDFFEGERIDRVELAPVELAATGGQSRPAPPGLSAFPEPGATYLSPALASLVATHPVDQLAGRFPGRVEGTVGPEGLAHPEELVAVVGRAAGELPVTPAGDRVTHADLSGAPSPVVPVAGFAADGSDRTLSLYRDLSSVAAVLLAMPAVLLIGSAARLTAARRDRRLATLRLAGATPGAVVVLTAVETAVAALIGAGVGGAAYVVALPLASKVPLAGGSWEPSQLWLGWPAVLVALLLIPVLAGASAVLGLRKVVISPLGVVRRVRARRPRAVRFAGLGASWVVFVLAASAMRDGGELLPVLIGFGAVIAGIAMIGPWLAWSLGALAAAAARKPSTLLAGRRIVADPQGAFRTVSGVVLAGLVAGFLFGVMPTVDEAEARVGPADTLVLELPDAIDDSRGRDLLRLVTATAPGAEARIASFGAEEVLETSAGPAGLDGATVERLRTVLAAEVPGRPLVADDDDLFGDRQLLHDLRRASVIVALVALVLATASGAVASAASVLDQRATLARLRLSGTPVRILQRARAWQATLPLVAATLVAVGSGVVAGLVLLVAFGAGQERLVSPSLAPLGLLVASAVVAGVLTSAVTRPVLLAATSQPLRDR